MAAPSEPPDQPEDREAPSPRPSLGADDPSRKFRTKHHNGHVKAFYSISNTLGATVIGAAYILPEVQGTRLVQELDRPGWVLLGLIVIGAGHAVIR